MAETCTIPLQGITTKKLRKSVRQFLKGGEVIVEVDSGTSYYVTMASSNLVFTSREGPSDLLERGKRGNGKTGLSFCGSNRPHTGLS